MFESYPLNKEFIKVSKLLKEEANNKKENLVFFDQLFDVFYDVSKNGELPNHNILLLLHNCVNSTRSAILLLAILKTIESTVVNRVALESLLYANHMSKDEIYISIWNDRHDSDQCATACRNKFSFGKVIKSVSNQETRNRFVKTYDQLIDFGGHPNVMSIFANTKVDKKKAEIYRAPSNLSTQIAHRNILITLILLVETAIDIFNIDDDLAHDYSMKLEYFKCLSESQLPYV